MTRNVLTISVVYSYIIVIHGYFCHALNVISVQISKLKQWEIIYRTHFFPISNHSNIHNEKKNSSKECMLQHQDIITYITLNNLSIYPNLNIQSTVIHIHGHNLDLIHVDFAYPKNT